MTTILISILSGVLGLIVGFALGIKNSAKSAADKISAYSVGEYGDYLMYLELHKMKR